MNLKMQLDEGESNRVALGAIRRGLGVTQREMAELMGVPLRTYEDLEAGQSIVRPIHLNAARYGAVVAASRRRPIDEFPDDVSGAVLKASRYLRGIGPGED